MIGSGTPSGIRAVGAALAALLALAGCETVSDMADPLAPDVIQEAGLEDAILQGGDADSAVAYFTRATARSPEDIALRRGLAGAYARAGRYRDARAAYESLLRSPKATTEDRLNSAFVSLRLDDWDSLADIASSRPEILRSPRGALLEAMIADRNGDWEMADAAYARAETGGATPAKTLNNWGVSLLARGEMRNAEATFARAMAADPALLIAKNNLAITRAMRGEYRLPNAPLADVEKATLLYNIGLVALERGERGEARRLFSDALNAHPRHYRAAAGRLAEMEEDRV